MSGLASCMMTQGALKIVAGQPDEAIETLRQSVRLMERCRDGALEIAKEYLLRALTLSAHVDEATALFDELTADQELEELDIYSCYVEDVGLALACLCGQWAQAQAQLDRQQALVGGLVEEVLVNDLFLPMMRFAASTCQAQGQHQLAVECLEQALELAAPDKELHLIALVAHDLEQLRQHVPNA